MHRLQMLINELFLHAVNPIIYTNNKYKLEAGHKFVNYSLIE